MYKVVRSALIAPIVHALIGALISVIVILLNFCDPESLNGTYLQLLF